MTLRIGWRQALAWRLRRHGLDPVGAASVEDVVKRLCGVQAQVPASAELAIRLRRRSSRDGDVGRALADGRVLRTWAMRGALHLLTPRDGPRFLAIIAASRPWARPSWQRAFGMTPERVDALRDAAEEALANGPLTREELIAAVTRRPELADMGAALGSGWGTLLKPLAWQGVLCHGPSEGGRVSFMRPGSASHAWTGLPEAEEAGPAAVAAYLGAYGPATPAGFGRWMASGWFGTRQLRRWFAALGDRLVAVEVEGEAAAILAEHADELASTRPTKVVRLLAGFDQFVLGPGTDDGHVVPADRRCRVSRRGGWISPVVIVGGVVHGTWELRDDEVRIAWLGDDQPPPHRALAAEVARLGAIAGRGLTLAIDPAP